MKKNCTDSAMSSKTLLCHFSLKIRKSARNISKTYIITLKNYESSGEENILKL